MCPTKVRLQVLLIPQPLHIYIRLPGWPNTKFYMCTPTIRTMTKVTPELLQEWQRLFDKYRSDGMTKTAAWHRIAEVDYSRQFAWGTIQYHVNERALRDRSRMLSRERKAVHPQPAEQLDRAREGMKRRARIGRSIDQLVAQLFEVPGASYSARELGTAVEKLSNHRIYGPTFRQLLEDAGLERTPEGRYIRTR